jgi:hypothetical protein
MANQSICKGAKDLAKARQVIGSSASRDLRKKTKVQSAGEKGLLNLIK